MVRRTDFRIAYRLDATTASGSRIPLVDRTGLLLQATVPNGASVSAGQDVGQAVVDPAVATPLRAGAVTSRLDQAALTRLTSFQGTVTAPVSGVIVTGTADGPFVQAPGIDVVVGLTPLQALRYESLTFTGTSTVETVIGQRQLSCTAVWVEATSPQEPAGTDDSNGTDAAGRLHCRLPSYAETAPGLRARIDLTSTPIHDAVVVPNIDLRYDRATDGYSVTIEQDGWTHDIPVTTGVTDGVVRVITSPLPVGAAIVPPSGVGG